jgi:hypothetical protein
MPGWALSHGTARKKRERVRRISWRGSEVWITHSLWMVNISFWTLAAMGEAPLEFAEFAEFVEGGAGAAFVLGSDEGEAFHEAEGLGEEEGEA